MSTRPTTARLLTGIAGAALAATLAAPASAATQSFTDPAGDGSNAGDSSGPRKWGDLGTVRVNHGQDKLKVVMKLAEGGEHADSYAVWIDTDANDPGPEFVMSVNQELFPQAQVRRAESFAEIGDRTCSAKSAVKTARTMKMTFHRSCFDTPQQVRASVHTAMDYEDADWAPGKRKFGAWVKTG